MYQRDIGEFYRNKIIVGTFKNTNNEPLSFSCPFSAPPAHTFSNSYDELNECATNILSGESSSSSSSHAREIVTHMPNYSSEVYEFASDLLNNFGHDVIDGISKQSTIQEIGSFWSDSSSKANLFSTTFSPAPASKEGTTFAPLRSVFDSKVLSELKETPSIFETATSTIISSYNEDRSEDARESIKLAFSFATESGLFDSIFFPRFIESVVERLRPQIDSLFEKDLSEYLVQAEELVSQEMTEVKEFIGLAALRTLKSALNELIFTSKFKKIVTNGLQLLVKSKDVASIKTCVELARETDQINEFVRRLSHVFEAEADCFKLDNPIVRILELHRTMLKFNEAVEFSPEHVKKIRISFEKGFNSSPDVAARLFAFEINNKFIHCKTIPEEELEYLLDIFKMLSCKDVFSAYHAYLLAKRVLLMKAHTIKLDQDFIAKLKILCGPEYTKVFNSIFEGLSESISMMNDLRSENKIPSWFTWILFSKESWENIEQCNAVMPYQVKPYLDICEAKARGEKKKVRHCLQLTRVKLNVTGIEGIKVIKCSGIYATYLLALNGKPSMTISQIADVTKLTIGQVEEITENLKRKKLGNLVIYSHQMVRINPDAKTSNGELNIAFSFPQIPIQEDTMAKSLIMRDRDDQVDSLIVRLLKQEKSLDRDDLKTMMKDILNFRMDDELFEKRLNSLNKRQFIKLDQSGCVNYLP